MAPPPPPERIPREVQFGRVAGENRGPEPSALIDPPATKDDPYFWLRDDKRKDEKVIAYLEEENRHCKQATEHIEGLADQLYLEMKSHLKETDHDVPYAVGTTGWRYFSRTVEGKSYAIHCRTKSPARAFPEEAIASECEVILDENEVAAAHSYCDVGCVVPSPSQDLLAYSVDATGYETYTVHLKDLRTGTCGSDGAPLEAGESIEETAGAVAWGASDQVAFYSKMDAAHRPHQLWVRIRSLGAQGAPADHMLFEESDERFWLSFWKSRSGRFLFVASKSKETTEMRMLDLLELDTIVREECSEPKDLDLAGLMRLIAARRQGVIYRVDHMEALDHLMVVTNAGAKKEFALCLAPVDAPGEASWFELEGFQYDPARYVLGVNCFRDFAVITGREDGLMQIWVLRLRKASAGAKVEVESLHRVPFDEDAYEVHFSARNKVYDTDCFRVIYSSMVTPTSTLEVRATAASGRPATEVLKVEDVPGYDASKYATTRMHVTARDGTRVPMSVLYRKPAHWDGSSIPEASPVFLYGYGSYGSCVEPSFSMSRLALVDRGVVYVIAHIRGGSELGRAWYEDHGKYLSKCNTFDDFVDAAKHLKASGVAAKVAIEGRSAGGLLVGAAMNRSPPGLLDVALAGVPFVDVMTTMCDPSIPLTIVEWEEWGNPNHPKYHDYIKSYSPIDNVRPESSADRCGVADYPALLITAGLHDPRVAYWEPAKWMATMRHALAQARPGTSAGAGESEPLLLLKTDLSSGHFSASDRYKWYKERAFDYAFVIDQLGAPYQPIQP